MNKLSNEVKIGLVVLAAIVVAYLGFRVMKDEPLFSATNIIYTKYANVDGLIKGGDVFLRGFKVGSVREMEFLPNGDSTLVTLNISEPISIPIGSKAQIVPALLGTASIEIVKSDNQQMISWGDFIEGTHEEGVVESFSDKGSDIADSVAITLSLTNDLLRSMANLEKGGEISSTISNIQESTESIAQIIKNRQGEIDAMILDAQKTLANVSELSDSSKQDLTSIISNLEKFSGELDSLSAEFLESSESMSSILSKIDIGEGTLGKMVNDPSLYDNLDSLTVNLNELIKSIQEDPKRYLKHMRLVDIF
ncbi:MAG: MCE family protein [Balneola sp.]|nr:MAG: MCE family protein [Balneola sp.]